jgi:hypothetical protein
MTSGYNSRDFMASFIKGLADIIPRLTKNQRILHQIEFTPNEKRGISGYH